MFSFLATTSLSSFAVVVEFSEYVCSELPDILCKFSWLQMVQGKYGEGRHWGSAGEHLRGALQRSTRASRALVLRFLGDIWMLRLIIFKVILSKTQ